MRFLDEALAQTRAGWWPQHDVIERAFLGFDHAKAGNMKRAEEYAAEIEALQEAHEARFRSKHGMPELHLGRINRPLIDWLDAIRSGAWQMPRRERLPEAMRIAAE
jgi:hypothetical protein